MTALFVSARPEMRPWFVVIAIACAASVGAALIAQYGFGMEPCPWCILQRMLYLLIALICGVAALVRWQPLRLFACTLGILLAACGAASALYQHVVAAKSLSCNLTLADRIITALHVDAMWPAVFEVRSSCADAAVSVLGVPFEYWSLALFVLVALALLIAARKLIAR